MKRIMKRGITLLLCLAMLLGMVGAVSAAPAEPETVGDLLQPAKDGAAGTPICITGQTQWNGLLGEAPESLGIMENNAVASAPDKGLVFYDDTDPETVYSYMRDQMTARNATFAVTHETADNYNFNNFADKLFQGAFAHTGVGNEGDYLRGLWNSRSYSVQGIEGEYLTYTFTMTYMTTAAQEKQMDAAVDYLLESLELNGYPDSQKVRMIYDWICNNVTYDHAGLEQGRFDSPLSWTPYKALIQGTSVCQGYALLFYRLALECGIDARFISGLGNDESHAWNIVRLGNYYYNVDATWDASCTEAGLPYAYFLRSTANFPDHIRDAEYDTAEFHSAYPMSPMDYGDSTHPHAWNDGAVTKEPTCLTDGEKTYTCLVCGAIVTEALPATGEHTWDSGVVTREVTCTTDGVRTYTCTGCGKYTKTERIPAVGKHTYTNSADMVCNVCGESRGNGYILVTETKTARPGDTVTLNIYTGTLANCENFDLSLNYDPAVFAYVSGTCNVTGGMLSGINPKESGRLDCYWAAAVGKTVSGKIFTIILKVRDDAVPGNTEFTITKARAETAGGSIAVSAGTLSMTVLAKTSGDVDGNDVLDTDDAVYLLLHIMFGEADFPVPSGMDLDYDGNGEIDTDDAVYLLLHIMFGEADFPLTA